MSAGFCAISAWTVPSSRSLTCFGPASKPTILTFAPASRTPLAAPSAENRLVPKMPCEVGVLLQRGLGLRGRLLGLVVGVLAPDVVEPGRLGAVHEALLARVGGRDARLDVDDEHLALAADQLGQRVGRRLAAGLVVGGDLRDRHVRLVERGVDEHDLRAGVGHLLDRRVQRLRVGRRDQHRVGLLGRDRVDDRGLLRGVELVRALEVERDAELLGLRPGPRSSS